MITCRGARGCAEQVQNKYREGDLGIATFARVRPGSPEGERRCEVREKLGSRGDRVLTATHNALASPSPPPPLLLPGLVLWAQESLNLPLVRGDDRWAGLVNYGWRGGAYSAPQRRSASIGRWLGWALSASGGMGGGNGKAIGAALEHGPEQDAWGRQQGGIPTARRWPLRDAGAEVSCQGCEA